MVSMQAPADAFGINYEMSLFNFPMTNMRI